MAATKNIPLSYSALYKNGLEADLHSGARCLSQAIARYHFSGGEIDDEKMQKHLNIHALSEYRHRAIMEEEPGLLYSNSLDYGGGPLARLMEAFYSYYTDLGYSALLVDPEKPALWSLYRSKEDALAGKYTQTTPGRALRSWESTLRHYNTTEDRIFTEGETFDQWIADMSNRWKVWCAPPEILIAKDEEEIRRVYRDGPRSCMSYDLSEYTPRVYPTACYDTPDIDVVYAMKADRIVARSLVNKVKNCFVRIYGNEAALRGYFREQGIRELRSLEGCTLKYVPRADYQEISPPGTSPVEPPVDAKHKQVLPYIDGNHTKAILVTDPEDSTKKHWLVGNRGSWCGNSVRGFATYKRVTACKYCESERSFALRSVFVEENVVGEEYCCQVCAATNGLSPYFTYFNARTRQTYAPREITETAVQHIGNTWSRVGLYNAGLVITWDDKVSSRSKVLEQDDHTLVLKTDLSRLADEWGADYEDILEEFKVVGHISNLVEEDLMSRYVFHHDEEEMESELPAVVLPTVTTPLEFTTMGYEEPQQANFRQTPSFTPPYTTIT
jgi:hypothetical protein